MTLTEDNYFEAFAVATVADAQQAIADALTKFSPLTASQLLFNVQGDNGALMIVVSPA